jgi:hypothetical protein
MLYLPHRISGTIEMQEQIKQLLIDSLENETGVGKTGAQLTLVAADGEEMEIERNIK